MSKNNQTLLFFFVLTMTFIFSAFIFKIIMPRVSLCAWIGPKINMTKLHGMVLLAVKFYSLFEIDCVPV